MMEIDVPEIWEAPEMILQKLAALERMGRGALGKEAFLSLAPFLRHPEFLVSAKTFLTLGRIGVPEDAEELAAWLAQEKVPHWQLQALDAFWQIPWDHEKKALLLHHVLQSDQHPITLRGILWLLGQCHTPIALEEMAHFLLSPRKMQIKDEVLNEVWFSLSRSYPELAQNLAKNHGDLAAWLRHRTWRGKIVYDLYPAPDYLWQIAKKQGVKQKDFQRIYYYPRQKHALQAGGLPG